MMKCNQKDRSSTKSPKNSIGPFVQGPFFIAESDICDGLTNGKDNTEL